MTASHAELLNLAAGTYWQVKAALGQLVKRPLNTPEEEAAVSEFLSGVEVSDSSWAEFEDTACGLRQVGR